MVKCPTLRDIRLISYNVFAQYINIISITLLEYLKAKQLDEKYNSLTPEQQEINSLYYLLVIENPYLFLNMLQFFLVDHCIFDNVSNTFTVYKKNPDGTQNIVGHIGNENFEHFREEMQMILGTKRTENEKPKFQKGSEKLGQKLYEKLMKSSLSKKEKEDSRYTIDNMIRKFCTHNKVGINILNVWDMTYYQFITMFGEYCKGRQYDFSDMMAVNSFNYKKSSDYNPLDYMKTE